MSRTPEHFQGLERLFHELRALEPSARDRRLAELEQDDGATAGRLRHMIEAAVSSGVLDHSPVPVADPAVHVGAISPGDEVGGYRIESVLAHGGMGTVYVARQERPAREVALKVMRAGASSTSARRRFELEAEILGAVRHPGIAQVHDAGLHATEHGEVPWYAMELVEGRPLDLWSRGIDGVTERLVLFVRICEAVAHAHAKGIIHRDLKPSNILVAEGDLPKILDFGVARVTVPELQSPTLETLPGQIVGTLAYMSPEQTEGDPGGVDTRSDVYALGVLLHEMLAGTRPFDLEDVPLIEALRRIREDEPAPLAAQAPGLDRDLELIAGKAMAKRRERRYESAAALAEDVRRYIAREPIVARPPSSVYRLSRFVKRRPAMAVACAGLIAVVLVGVVATAIAFGKIDEQRRVAQGEAERARLAAIKYEGMLAFLDETIAANDPMASGPRELSLLGFLDLVAAGLPRRFPDDPESALLLRGTVGKAYSALGRNDEATKHLVESLRDRRGLYGDEHVETAHGRLALGRHLRRLDDYPGARRELLEAERIYRRDGEASRSALVRTLASIADIAHQFGDYDESERRAREGLALAHDAGIADGAEIAAMRVVLSAMSLLRNDPATAREHIHVAMEAVRTTFGDRHPYAAVLDLGMCEVLLGLERPMEALEHSTRALKLMNSGTEEKPHYRILFAEMDVHGRALYQAGRFPEALKYLTHLLECQEARDISGLTVARTLEALAIVQRAIGRNEDALATAERCLALRRKVHTEHVTVARALTRLARAHVDLQNYAQAEKLAREADEMNLRLGSNRRLNSLTVLSLALGLGGKRNETLPLQRELVKIAEARWGAGHPRAINYHLSLGMILHELGRHEDAEPELARVEELAKHDVPVNRPWIAACRETWGSCLIALDRVEEGEAQLVRGLEEMKALRGAGHPSTLRIARALIRFYEDEDLQDRADAIRRQLRVGAGDDR